MRKDKFPKIFSLNMVLLLLVVLANIALFAQNPAGEISEFGRPFLRKFTDDSGLPINSVMTLKRDNRGFIWAGTQDGIAFFNGHRWTSVNLPNRNVSNYVFDILPAKDGSIWIGTDGGGLHKFNDNQWQTFDSGKGLISNAIRCLAETFDENGNSIIWIGTRDGLSRFDGTNFQNFDNTNGLPDKRVRSVLQTADKSIWIATYGGIAIWKDSEKRVFNNENGLPHKTVYTLLETKNSNNENVVWAGTEAGLAKFENGIWTNLAKTNDLPIKGVRSLTESETSNGEKIVWAGFDEAGLAYLEKGRWRILDDKLGLPNNIVFGLEKSGSPDGSVWISTLGAGVSRLERSNFLTYNDQNGLSNKTVFAINESPENSFWVGTFGGGAMRFQNGIWTKFDTKNGLPNDYVHCFLRSKSADGSEITYIGTEKGLVKFEKGRIEEIKLPSDGLREIWDLVETVESDGSKSLWIAGGGGIGRINNGNLSIFTNKDGLPDIRTRAILETVEPNGERILWFATLGGLAKYQNGKFEGFTTNNGLPNNRVYSLAEIKDDSARQLWIGTGGGGAAILNLDAKEISFQTISTETNNLLPNDTVLQIFQDQKKRIYLTTNKGVARLRTNKPFSELDFQSFIFTTEDGLPSNECVTGASLVDSLGRVWIGTVAGIGLLDLTKEFIDLQSDPIFLERVLVGGKERLFGEKTELKYNENNLVFEYALLSNFRESGTRYQTQLVGLEEKPTEWTNEPRREFNFLPDGNFTLKIWGRDAGGNISQPVEIPFRIYPAWWRTWWAYTLYFVTFAAIISLIAFLIYRNRLIRLLELERVRNRIATDLHDDIGASLSQISILSEILANNPARKDKEEQRSLTKIAETSREVTSSMSDIVWAINPKRDNVQDLVQRMRHFASDILSAKDIDFTFFAPIAEENRKIDVDLRRQIYLVFKEAINNCAKHSECADVEINFDAKDGFYVLKIKDNGKGFDLMKSALDSTFGGNGVTSMNSRAEAVGGSLEIVSENGNGTEIILKVPPKQ